MEDFIVGDHVEAINIVYKNEGIRLGQRGRIVKIMDSGSLVCVKADTPNSAEWADEEWGFYLHEITKVK